MSATNALCVWDWTIFNEDNHENVIELCEKYTKHWCFQEEKCPTTGKLHFQGRVSLLEKTRKPFWPNVDMKWTITSNPSTKDVVYVTKVESRVRGPWSDRDEKIYIPRDVRDIKTLLPWQTKMAAIIQTYERRKVNIVVDPKGNTGKSTFVRICRVYKLARKIPYANDYRDIMRMVMDMPESKAYLFDLPRAISKEKLYQFFSAIEEIKGGYAFDDRYNFKERIFDPPVIVIFTNKMPDQALLSGDRWNLLGINSALDLEACPTDPVIISKSNSPAQPEQFDKTSLGTLLHEQSSEPSAPEFI